MDLFRNALLVPRLSLPGEPCRIRNRLIHTATNEERTKRQASQEPQMKLWILSDQRPEEIAGRGLSTHWAQRARMQLVGASPAPFTQM